MTDHNGLSLPELLIAATAAFRITWLIVDDYLTASARGWLVRFGYRLARGRQGRDQVARRAKQNANIDTSRLDAWPDVVGIDEHPPKLAYLWTCPWCAGLWVSAAVVASMLLWPNIATPVLTVFAVAAIVAFLAELASNLRH